MAYCTLTHFTLFEMFLSIRMRVFSRQGTRGRMLDALTEVAWNELIFFFFSRQIKMFLGVNTTCEEREAKREDVLLFFFLSEKMFYTSDVGRPSGWMSRSAPEGVAKTAEDYSYRLSGFLKWILILWIFLPPPANWRASHFEILLFRIMSRSPPVGAFWRFFPALRRNNTRFQNFKPSTQC